MSDRIFQSIKDYNICFIKNCKELEHEQAENQKHHFLNKFGRTSAGMPSSESCQNAIEKQ